MLKSKTWVRPLSRMFQWSDPEDKQIQIQMIRLTVLYEDLILELDGAVGADRLFALGHGDAKSRRFYFVRRALATTWEIRQAIGALNRNQRFARLKQWMMPNNRTSWDRAVEFFETNHDLLKAHRNDLGGHFTDAAATFVIDNLDAKSQGTIEIYRTDHGVKGRLTFAYELVAIALSKEKPGDVEVDDHLRSLFATIVNAHKHAVLAAQVIIAEHLLRR